MSHPDLSLGGPDIGHTYPRRPQGNLAHTPVAITPWAVDDILTIFDVPAVRPADGSSRIDNVWKFPSQNRANSTK